MPHADRGLFSRLRASLYGIIFILYRRINLLQRLAHKLVSDQLTGSREFGEHHLHSVRRRLLFGLSTRNHLVAELLTSPEFATTLQNTTPVTTALNTLITNDPPHNPTITNHSILTTLFNRLASFDNSLNSSDLDRSLRVLVAAQSTRGELTGPVSERERRILSTVADGDRRLEREIFDEILGGSTIQRFGGADFYYPDTNSAWVLTNEIWVGEDYFFESSREDPLVIDAGVHAGMAILYVKSLYPKARVIGFEPNPEMFDLAQKNISALRLENVELLPYALSNREGPVTFYGAQKDSMASSLQARPRPNESYETEIVEARRLSHWLTEPVDFLKMDIEGAESEVILECGGSLKKVHHVFIEYHQEHSLGRERLAKILAELDQQGFVVNMGKSWGHHARTSHRPLQYVANPYSGVIWATNTEWKY